MHTERLLTNITTDRLAESRDFYVQHFGFEVGYDSDWFVNLLSPDKRLEIGLLQQDHELLPEAFREQSPAGVYLTFVVPDVNEWYEAAKAARVPILPPPEDTFYGQRRCLVEDPNGLLIDVSTPAKRL
jgi:catechol 2,3-dioxygenase-like lactoylglutathione lyase family enzyme